MEAAISSSLSHPNICSTYTYSINEMKDVASKKETKDASGAADSSNLSPHSRLHLGYEVQLVLEFCDLGCLRTFLDNRGFYDVELPTSDGGRRPCLYSILATARDIASAMAHVSTRQYSIVHHSTVLSTRLYNTDSIELGTRSLLDVFTLLAVFTLLDVLTLLDVFTLLAVLSADARLQHHASGPEGSQCDAQVLWIRQPRFRRKGG